MKLKKTKKKTEKRKKVKEKKKEAHMDMCYDLSSVTICYVTDTFGPSVIDVIDWAIESYF